MPTSARLFRFRRSHVLIADDDDDFLELLGDALQAEGHRVTRAHNGCELVDQVMASLRQPVAGERFSLVLSDIKMPGGTGLQALKSLRREKDAPPILLMTAFGSQHTHDAAMQLGAVGVIDKPFDIEDFCLVVANLAEYYRPRSTLVTH